MAANFESQIVALSRSPKRPDDPQDLLLKPVGPNPGLAAAWKGQWMVEHGTKLRFYVGGLDWFLTSAKITVDQLATFKADAVREANISGWRKAPGASSLALREMQPLWERFSKPQFYSARSREPMQFTKACLVILACELALQDRLTRQKDGKLDPADHIDETITAGSEIYNHMAVVPACWNVSGLTAEYLDRQKQLRPTFIKDLALHLGQEDKVVTQLSSGHTCSYETASAIVDYCGDKRNASEIPGEVRATSGRGGLGTARAAEEALSLDY